MRVFVTGGAGFVGARLVPRLGRDGHDVTTADVGAAARATTVALDVRDPDAVQRALAAARPDAVIHLAAQSSEAASGALAEQTWRVNYGGALAVLRGAAAVAPAARVLMVGSGIAYGPAAPGAAPYAEDAPLAPASPYARSKAAADRLGAAFAADGLGVVRVRPFNHSGPGQPDAFALPSFARQVAEIEAGRREPVLTVGNLDSIRDFLHVDDVVEAYVRLLAPGLPVGAYNVCRGEGVRVGDLLDGLLAAAGVRAEVRVDPARVRPTDALVGSAARLRGATDWKPRIEVPTLLADLLAWWRAAIKRS